ncbi:MAG: hypothetical protein HUJ54_07475, partial [Erysipelotrichaceae bacterium]|nr:hypothetical protein [Erysipelotrichaceae bacterium]
MKHLQTKYNFLQILYWMAICSLHGFAAIFLSSKGLTNTEIGAATGGACILSIFFSPVLTSISMRFNKISLQKYIAAGMILTAAVYLMMASLPLPGFVMISFYIIGCCTGMSLVSFLSQISMDYIEQGQKLNFGLASGLGSFSYAVSAVVFAQAAAAFTPAILPVLCAAASIPFVILLFRTKPVYAIAPTVNEKGGTLLSIITRYPRYFIILIGFAFIFA